MVNDRAVDAVYWVVSIYMMRQLYVTLRLVFDVSQHFKTVIQYNDLSDQSIIQLLWCSYRLC